MKLLSKEFLHHLLWKNLTYELISTGLAQYQKVTFHNFIKNLPKTGSQLKSLQLGSNHLSSTHRSQFKQIKRIVNNCPNLEQLSLGSLSKEYGNVTNVLSYEAMMYLCEHLPQNIIKLEFDEQTNFNDPCLWKVAKRFKNLKALDISGTQVSYYGLVAFIDDLSSLEYLKIPEQVATVLGANYPDSIKLLEMKKLSPMKNLKNLICENGFDFGNPEQYDLTYSRWMYVEPRERERKKEILRKAIMDFPNLVPQQEDCYQACCYNLQIARIDSSSFSKVDIFPYF